MFPRKNLIMFAFDIPTWVVAFTALFTTIIAYKNHVKISMRAVSITTGLQFLIYLLFTFGNFTVDERQDLARISVITMNLVLSGVLLITKRNSKDG
jgi:hypothetical protein